jgi:leucyl-tRNA synthetase
MHKHFDHTAFEGKWQTTWKETELYNTGARDQTKEKEYILVELPYPSGNLHIGHWYAFAIPDIYVRYRRMQGKQVIYPMGFDAFGLPAENAAIKRGVNPKEWTEGNIEFMKTQLESMGAAFSWDKTTATIDPDYYKWTQWMFTKFYENDIAYRGEGVVNWCPHDHTVIANEQVLADGTCERCGTIIEKREMPQWKLRITDYADALIDDLNTLSWPEHIKEAQRQWIGRSKGAEIDFELSVGDVVTVFTTRPDTLFGATYLVLAPEHAFIQKYQSHIKNWEEVATYVQTAKQKDDRERGDATKEKTGVKLEGITAKNPASGEDIPVYIADYVLGGYGTGAIMAVPAHDERDKEFAFAFDIPSIAVVDGRGTLMNSDSFNGMNSEEARVAITQNVGGRMTNTYRLRDWSIGRQRYWGVPIPIVYDPAGQAHVVPKEHLPWLLPKDVDCTPTGVPPLSKSVELKERTERIFGAGWTPEVETMDTFVDSSWYFMRYLDNQNQDEFTSLQSQNDWLPVDMYFGGAEHTTMHLLYSRFWQKALHKLGLVAHNEPYERRANHGMILGPDGNKMSKSKGNVIDPDEQVKLVGSDTVRMYLAFMGPYENSSYPWDPGGVAGLRRFLERVNGLREHISDTESRETTTLLHKTIKKVAEDIEAFKFNTAISALMIFINHAEKAGLSTESYVHFLRLLAPFAPHITEELWQELGNTQSIHSDTFPMFDPALAQDDTVTIGVQINGKHRGEITIAVNATQDVALAAVAANVELQSKLVGGEVVKTIFVPGRIMNLIVKER